MSNTCSCGDRATLLVRVLKDPDANASEAVFATCDRHVVEAIAEMEKVREKINGVIVVRNDRPDAHKQAWFLVKHCPWQLHAPEILILLALAGAHADGSEWVSDFALANRRQCSKQNALQSINRPRLNDPEYPMVRHEEHVGQDGLKRIYHRLVGWE